MEYTKEIKGECGCSTGTGRSGNPFIIYCPLHKAAPDLYEACKEAFSFCDDRIRFKIKQALTKAEGK